MPPPVDWTLARIAERQHGALTIAQIEAAGLSEGAVRKRVARGALHRKYAGVYTLGHAVLSQEGEWMAATLAGGIGAVLSHLSAAGLWRLWRDRRVIIDVLAPRGRRPKGPVRVHGYRRLDPLDVTVVRGIPVTTIARLFVDLSDFMEPNPLANLIHEAAYLDLFDLEETRAAMARANGRHKLHVLDAALAINAGGGAGTKSGPERAFERLIKGRVPAPRVNVQVEGLEVDFFWPRRRLVVEVDGPGHSRPRTKREDALKQRILEAAGYVVLRFTDVEIERRPADVLKRLGAGL